MQASERFDPEFRRTHLGASQVPAAIGVSPYERPITLWEKYRGLRDWDSGITDDEEAQERVDLGQELEEGIARYAARRLGLRLERAPRQTHPRIPWLVSSRDFVVLDDGVWVPLEIKTAGLVTPLWREARERWGPDGSDEAPIAYVAQEQTQILVDRACVDANPPEHGYIAALLAGDGTRIYRLPYREDIARGIVSQANAFWQRVVDPTLGPPPPDGSDEYTRFLTSKLITHPRQQRWTEGEQADELGPRVQATYAARDAAQEAYELAKQQALALIGDGDGLRGAWGSVPQGYRAGKVGLNQGRLRARLAQHFLDVDDPDQNTALTAANIRAQDFIDECKTEGEPFTVFGPPRAPPKNPKRKK